MQKLADKYLEVEEELNTIAAQLDETCEDLVMAYVGAPRDPLHGRGHC